MKDASRSGGRRALQHSIERHVEIGERGFLGSARRQVAVLGQLELGTLLSCLGHAKLLAASLGVRLISLGSLSCSACLLLGLEGVFLGSVHPLDRAVGLRGLQGRDALVELFELAAELLLGRSEQRELRGGVGALLLRLLELGACRVEPAVRPGQILRFRFGQDTGVFAINLKEP